MHPIKSKNILSLGSKKMLRELVVQCTGVYRLYIKKFQNNISHGAVVKGDMSGTKRGAERSRQ